MTKLNENSTLTEKQDVLEKVLHELWDKHSLATNFTEWLWLQYHNQMDATGLDYNDVADILFDKMDIKVK